MRTRLRRLSAGDRARSSRMIFSDLLRPSPDEGRTCKAISRFPSVNPPFLCPLPETNSHLTVCACVFLESYRAFPDRMSLSDLVGVTQSQTDSRSLAGHIMCGSPSSNVAGPQNGRMSAVLSLLHAFPRSPAAVTLQKPWQWFFRERNANSACQ